MILRNVRFEPEQISFLMNLPGKFSEHVRRAVDEYITRKKNSDVSVSMSEMKGGKKNG